MRAAPRYIPRYTLDDYRHWDGKWELIDGVAIAMTPSPFGPHERVISRLSRMIGLQIEQLACPCEVYTNLDWIVSQETVIRPDLMVVCGEQPQRYLERAPSLVVEVVSPATQERDRITKRTIYFEQRVPHYLIIDPHSRTMDWFTMEGPQLGSAEDRWILELAEGGCRIALDRHRLFD